MAVFGYRGLRADSGKAVKGVRDAESVKALRALLRKEGVLLTHAEEEKERQAAARRDIQLFEIFTRPSFQDVSVMTRQLGTLVRAGIPLVESLSALTEQIEKVSLVRIVTSVREKVNEGIPFSKALSEHPRVFPAFYTNMVAAGEASGTLEAVLERLADFMEKQAALRGKVTAALAYPALMAVVGSIMVAVMMVAVVPKVTAIFANMGKELPWYTNLLIVVSAAISGYWWLIAGVTTLLVVLFQRWVATTSGRMTWDTFQLNAPIIGRLNLLVAAARFSRTLSTLLASGVQLLAAMEIGRAIVGNARIQAVLTTVIESIREGESISEPLKRAKVFPVMMIHMIAVGERTGQLEEMLENVSRAYEAEVDSKVMALTSLLEPLTIVVLGTVVGFIAMSILMPLIQMNEMVN